VVRNVDIYPKYKSIYAGQTDSEFTFEIMHGSGHFDYKINATELVTDFKLKGRQITFKPNGLGSFRIEVFDHELPDALPAIAEILLSDVHKL
jgi:hypothetical protein